MVIFAVINGLTISLSSMAELLFDKKSYIKLSDEERKMIEIIEEIEVALLKEGKDPNRLNMDDIIAYLDKRIRQESSPTEKIRYVKFKKELIAGVNRKYSEMQKSKSLKKRRKKL